VEQLLDRESSNCRADELVEKRYVFCCCECLLVALLRGEVNLMVGVRSFVRSFVRLVLVVLSSRFCGGTVRVRKARVKRCEKICCCVDGWILAGFPACARVRGGGGARAQDLVGTCTVHILPVHSSRKAKTTDGMYGTGTGTCTVRCLFIPSHQFI
jgi:hypothetical protein